MAEVVAGYFRVDMGSRHTRGQGLAALSESFSEAACEYARSAFVLGRALRECGKKVEAREQLRLALDTASRVGAAGLIGDITDELAAANAKPTRPRLVGVGSLTPAQRRVAKLAAAGLTNQEIAAELWITLKTVETHLAASFKKLGVASRLQLAEVLAGAPPVAAAA